MKSLLAPMTRISVVLSGTEGTGNDAFSFLKSNSGNFELSFISDWYLQESDEDVILRLKDMNSTLNNGCAMSYPHNDGLIKYIDLGEA